MSESVEDNSGTCNPTLDVEFEGIVEDMSFVTGNELVLSDGVTDWE